MSTTVRDFVCGRTQMGKSRCIRTWILRDRPRVIVVDPIGDYPLSGPRVFTIADALSQVREHVYRGRTAWRVVLSVGRDQIGGLVDSVVPPLDVYGSWCRSVGGITVVLDEVGLLTPRGQGGEKISALFRVGRHAEISVVAATQRPVNVSKEVIAQADRVIAYRLTDPDDIAYLRSTCGPDAMKIAETAWTKPYHAMIWEQGEARILTPTYNTTSHVSGQLKLEA